MAIRLVLSLVLDGVFDEDEDEGVTSKEKAEAKEIGANPSSRVDSTTNIR